MIKTIVTIKGASVSVVKNRGIAVGGAEMTVRIENEEGDQGTPAWREEVLRLNEYEVRELVVALENTQ